MSCSHITKLGHGNQPIIRCGAHTRHGWPVCDKHSARVLDTPDDDGPCELCTNPATIELFHAELGWTDTCAQCAEHVGVTQN